MEVKINDDLQSFVGDVSNRGWICGTMAGFFGLVAYLGVGRTVMPQSLEGIPTMIVATPFLLFGFFRVQSMPFEVWLRSVLNTLFFRRGRRLYRAENAYKRLISPALNIKPDNAAGHHLAAANEPHE